MKEAMLVYDIKNDDYWLIVGKRKLLLKGLVCKINGLVDNRPLAELPDFEKDGIEESNRV